MQPIDHSPGLSSFQFTESRIRNDRQAIFDLTRQLVHAQFELADQELTNRLWEEVIQRNIEIERILNLMYRCTSHEDENEMTDSFMGGLQNIWHRSWIK